MTKVVVTKLYCPLETTKVDVAELLAQYEEMAIAELLVDQKEWQVHFLQVMTSVFGLTIYATFCGDMGPSKKILHRFHNMN
jgi:hypothetical protein